MRAAARLHGNAGNHAKQLAFCALPRYNAQDILVGVCAGREQEYRNMTNLRKKLIQADMVNSYEEFVNENLLRTNKRLNSILWACIAAGPLIALFVRLGVFHAVRYSTCMNASLFMTVLALVHLVMLKKRPNSTVTGLIALFAVDGLLIYMNYAHVGIYVTWILVPLMSLLFCDRKIFVGASVINFCCMVLSLWLVSPYYAALRSDYAAAADFFAARLSG